MPEIVRVDNIDIIKNKITQIKRTDRKSVLHNYYNNCEQDNDIYSVFGDNSIVFWNNDNGVYRVYFCSSDSNELIELLEFVPENACMEYLVKGEGSIEDIAKAAGFELEFTMQRYSMKRMNDDEIKELENFWAAIKEATYIPGLVRVAEQDDCLEILDKLYEVFNPRESHLCTEKELRTYIDNKWVCVARDSQHKLVGIQIFLVEAGYRKYGYQIWSDDDVEILSNLQIVSNELYNNYVEVEERKLGHKITKLPPYAWVNKNNKIAVRNVKVGGSFFDGLYDYGFCKKGN